MTEKVGVDDLIAACGGGKKAKAAILSLPVYDVYDETSHVPLALHVVDAEELDALDLAEREVLIDGVMEAASMTLIFGPTGIGKSWFCMELLRALAASLENFLAWKVRKTARCLLIDGEMPLYVLQKRARLLDIPHNGQLLMLPSEPLYEQADPLNLNDYEQQGRIHSLLDDLENSDKKPDVVVFDNLSSLTAGFDENSNSDLDALLYFLIGLRHRGYAVVLVHHAGKSGDQRGASRRVDLMDTVIKLTGVPNSSSTHATFEVTFPKTRGMRPNPDSIIVEVESSGRKAELTYTSSKQKHREQWEEVLRIVDKHAPRSAKDVAEIMGLSVITARQHIRKAKNNGYLEEKRAPTLSLLGKDHLRKLEESRPKKKF